MQVEHFIFASVVHNPIVLIYILCVGVNFTWLVSYGGFHHSELIAPYIKLVRNKEIQASIYDYITVSTGVLRVIFMMI
jgi:hypothetical protein